jgi:hypothetical protein
VTHRRLHPMVVDPDKFHNLNDEWTARTSLRSAVRLWSALEDERPLGIIAGANADVLHMAAPVGA